MRAPITMWPNPSWFFDNKATHVIGEKIVRFEIAPSALKVPGLTAAALRG
jgi:aldehyde dehydrogenase (NAD(P)+)